jgi:hypothetical protein
VEMTLNILHVGGWKCWIMVIVVIVQGMCRILPSGETTCRYELCMTESANLEMCLLEKYKLDSPC